MSAGTVGFLIGLGLALISIRTQERNMKRSGYGNTSMAQREALNRMRVSGVGDHQPSGRAEYGCALVFLPGLGLVAGLLIGLIF